MNGVLSRAGYAACTSWTQGWQTPTKQVRLVSESLTQSFDKIRSAALLGFAAENEFFLGHQTVTGELVVDLEYDGGGLLEYAMGAAASTTYTFTDQLSKLFHLTIDKNSAADATAGNLFRYRFDACKVNSFTISGEVGESPVRLSLNLTAKSCVTSEVVFPTLTGANFVDEPVIFKHLSYVRLGTQNSTIDASDNLAVKSFEISVDNALQADAKDSSDASYILEPFRNGFRKVTLKLGLARYLTSAPTSSLAGWKSAGDLLQAILYLYNGTDSYTISLPEIKLVDGVNWNVGGPGMIEDEVTFEAFRNLHNTSGTGGCWAVTDQMQIVTV